MTSSGSTPVARPTVNASPIVALIVDSVLVEEADQGQDVQVVTAKTPFYANAGGQLGDAGVIETDGGSCEVPDTQKPLDGLVVHFAKVTTGSLKVGSEAQLKIDVARREAIRRNHSATHLLHLALRDVVGGHAQQKGSLVGPDRLRFDFTHQSAVTPEQMGAMEDKVNERIFANRPVQTEVLTMDQARERGAMMIFEEKYGDVVRMLTIGDSTELCGGTHARATGDIGLFKILSEGGVAAGVRRITAVTGAGALAYTRDLEGDLARAATAAKAEGGNVAEKIEKIVAQNKTLEKRVAELEKKLSTGADGPGMAALLEQARELAGVKVLGIRTEVTDRSALRELAEQLRDKLGESIVLVASEDQGKAQLVLTVTKSLNGRFRAGDLIKPIAQLVGGSGGGRPDMAQAGGTDPSRLDDAVAAVYAGVESSSVS